jgi:hypothetical protein
MQNSWKIPKNSSKIQAPEKAPKFPEFHENSFKTLFQNSSNFFKTPEYSWKFFKLLKISKNYRKLQNTPDNS